MNSMRKMFVLLMLAFLPLAIFAMKPMSNKGMAMPKGQEGTWHGLISGNECAIMEHVCDPSHVATEVPILIPQLKNGGWDFHHVVYFAGLPLDKQKDAFGKEVKVTGTLYSSTSTVLVKTAQVKEGNAWQPLWSSSGMNGMNKKEMKKTGY